MFATPVAKSRSSSPHRTTSKTVGRAPSQAGKERSFRSSELAIDGPERESTDAASADLAAKRVGLASWEPASISVFPPSGKVNRLGARNGPALAGQAVIGAVGDPLEREADQIAEQVMGAPRPRAGNSARRNAAPQVQRKCSACAHQEEEHGDQHGQCAECEKEDKEKKVARRAVSSAGTTAGIEAPATVSHVLRSPGQPLDRSSRSFLNRDSVMTLGACGCIPTREQRRPRDRLGRWLTPLEGTLFWPQPVLGGDGCRTAAAGAHVATGSGGWPEDGAGGRIERGGKPAAAAGSAWSTCFRGTVRKIIAGRGIEVSAQRVD